MATSTVTVTYRNKRYYLTFSRLPGKKFGPWTQAEAIRDLTVSALLDRLDARTLVMDAAQDGAATKALSGHNSSRGETMATALKGGGSRARKRKRGVAKSIAQIKQNAERCGSHWFEKGTLRFFGSRLSHKTFPAASGRCTYFVSSEKQRWDTAARAYSVRKACGCKIDTVGGFQAYKTLKSAQAAAKRAAAKS